MRKHNAPCAVCKSACLRNQNLVRCKTCKLYAHLKCSGVGMNFGNHNFICTACHEKKAFIIELINSTHASLDGEDQTLYHNIESVNKIQNKNLGDISIVHINSRSLVLNFDSIISFLEKVKFPEIICVSETRLKNKKMNWQSKLVNIPNYELIFDNSPTNAGGVAIYIKKDFFEFEVKDLKLDMPGCESLFLEINMNNKSANNTGKTLLLGSVYRHPKSNTSLFIEKLCDVLEKYTECNTPVAIFGDINIDVSKTSSDNVKRYTNSLSCIGCENIIKTYTRFGKTKKGYSRSVLDHILTNMDKDKFIGGVISYPITDHLPTFVVIKQTFIPTENKREEPMWRFIDDKKKEKFLNILEQHLKNIDLTNHPEKLLECLTTATKASIEDCFPLRKMSNRARKRSLVPWYDSEIFKDERTQSKLFRRFVKSNKVEDHLAYSTFRNQLSKKKYRAKRKYFQDLLGDAKKNGDKSKTWEVINKAFGKNKNNRVCPEKVNTGDPENPTISKCPKEVANGLNKHFSCIAEKLAKKLTLAPYSTWESKTNLVYTSRILL